MKTKKLGLLIVFVAACSGYAQGFLVTNGISRDVAGIFHVVQNPQSLDETSFFFTHEGDGFFKLFKSLDEGSRLFFVVGNSPFGEEQILNASYPELLEGSVHAMPGSVPFYLGIYTGYAPQGGIYENPLYGWAQVANIGGSIQLLDGALAFGAGGIYVGTQTIIPVPEPTAMTLCGFSLMAMSWWLRRSRHGQ
jgi:hypothetical protein